nr:hypothetical protein [Pandoravirus massiliensis]
MPPTRRAPPCVPSWRDFWRDDPLTVIASVCVWLCAAAPPQEEGTKGLRLARPFKKNDFFLYLFLLSATHTQRKKRTRWEQARTHPTSGDNRTRRKRACRRKKVAVMVDPYVYMRGCTQKKALAIMSMFRATGRRYAFFWVFAWASFCRVADPFGNLTVANLPQAKKATRRARRRRAPKEGVPSSLRLCTALSAVDISTLSWLVMQHQKWKPPIAAMCAQIGWLVGGEAKWQCPLGPPSLCDLNRRSLLASSPPFSPSLWVVLSSRQCEHAGPRKRQEKDTYDKKTRSGGHPSRPVRALVVLWLRPSTPPPTPT